MYNIKDNIKINIRIQLSPIDDSLLCNIMDVFEDMDNIIMKCIEHRRNLNGLLIYDK